MKGIQAAQGVFEMSWSGDGRATFQYGNGNGTESEAGQPHVIWRRIGGHAVLGDPMSQSLGRSMSNPGACQGRCGSDTMAADMRDFVYGWFTYFGPGPA